MNIKKLWLKEVNAGNTVESLAEFSAKYLNKTGGVSLTIKELAFIELIMNNYSLNSFRDTIDNVRKNIENGDYDYSELDKAKRELITNLDEQELTKTMCKLSNKLNQNYLTID